MSPTRIAEMPRLRPYQCEAARAVLASIRGGLGRTITIEVARQGGKNELSAQLELLLLGASAGRDTALVKCAPTLRPQLRVSMHRLWTRIGQAGLGVVAFRDANAIGLGRARALFLSAAPGASVVGHTASLLLEADEAQDVDEERFHRDFRPMAATTNATTVMYGTPWDEAGLLERAKQANLEAERRDGERRHFAYDWRMVARYVPAYAAHVAEVRERLGETHPLFLTQYCLKPVPGAGRLFTQAHLALLHGSHEAERGAVAGATYVAGLDIAGGDDAAPAATRDSTVLTIGRLVFGDALGAFDVSPRIEVVALYAWTGEPHESLLPQVAGLLRDTWRVACVAVDATGIGETIARLLASALGSHRVDPLKFTAESKSQLGFAMLAAINSGRLRMHRDDGSPAWREAMRQAERARVAYRPNRTMNFYVDPNEGHDDALVALALLVRASRDHAPRKAQGRMRAA